MDNLKKFLKDQNHTYDKNNTFELNFSKNISDNIQNLNIEEDNFFNILRKFRNYKLNYSQGKKYQHLNKVCITSCNRNSEIYNYNILERKILDINGSNILIQNRDITNLNIFANKKDYSIEENYEVFTVHINDNLKINFEVIGESHQIKILLTLERNIPNTYFEEYIKEINKIIDLIGA